MFSKADKARLLMVAATLVLSGVMAVAQAATGDAAAGAGGYFHAETVC